jgi:SPP1 family predicted phage head-tail adaptor
MIEAGKMTERVTLAARTTENPDSPIDYGNTVSSWADQGSVWSEFVHLRGGEAVMAGRLQGRHTLVVRVRATPFTREVTSDWKVTDSRGVEYAVRDVTPHVDRSSIDLLCESGVAV